MQKWEYRDPMEVAERNERRRQRQEAACGNCANRVSMNWSGETLNNCSKKGRKYGWRCWDYEEKQ